MGGRAANLSRLIAARFAVPRGFVISADAQRFHLYASGVRDIDASLATPESRQAVREAIANTDISDDIWTAIAEAYRRLSLQIGFEEPNVVVSASPLESGWSGEDLTGVSGQDALKAAVKQIWASAWYVESPPAEPAVGVIVRQMIENGPRGVVCTADPATGDPGSVVIACGNCEHTASFKVDLRDVRIAHRDGDLPDDLDEGAVVRLAEQSVLAERVVSSPVSIDWVYEGGVFWMVRAAAVDDAESRGRHALPRESDGIQISLRPVSHLARALFFADVREGVYLQGGYAYSSYTKYNLTTQGWRSAAEQLLEKWCRHTRPELTSKAAEIMGTDLKSLDYSRLTEVLGEAADLAARSSGWLEKMRQPCESYPRMLEEMLSGIEHGSELCERMVGGIECGSFMRDARLQEFGDRLEAARTSGRLENEAWWRAYRQEVGLFAAEHGYSFCDAGEMWDPACWTSWVEDVDTVFRMIGAIARRGNRSSLVTLHCVAVESAASAGREAVEMLQSRDRSRLSKLIKAARDWLSARDQCEQAFALACTALRLAVMEMGRRLSEGGVIAHREDAFYLTVDELRAISSEPSTTERGGLVATIAARKHETWLEERLARHPASTEPDSADELRGRLLVAGSAAGRARVVRSVADAGEIEVGEIMVVRCMSQAWTPFLGVAGGLISEMDCDACPPTVARDYGVPILTDCAGVVAKMEAGRRIILNADGTVSLSQI